MALLVKGVLSLRFLCVSAPLWWVFEFFHRHEFLTRNAHFNLRTVHFERPRAQQVAHPWVEIFVSTPND